MASDAMRQLPAGSREWLRAQDLIAASLAHQRHGRDEDSAGIHFSAGPADGNTPNGFGSTPNGFGSTDPDHALHSGFAQRP
jgi:hypothetical protein